MANTRYQVFSGERLVIDSLERPAGCFASYNYGSYWTGSQIVKVFLQKQNATPFEKGYEIKFNEEQIKEHLDKLQELFPTSLEETENDFVVILNEADYISKTHIRTGLDFVRILFEIPGILEDYYKLPEATKKKYSYFEILQYLCVSLKARGEYVGHGLPSYYCLPGGIISGEDMLAALRKAGNKIEGSFKLWTKFYLKANPHLDTAYGPAYLVENYPLRLEISQITDLDKNFIPSLEKLLKI